MTINIVILAQLLEEIISKVTGAATTEAI